MTYSATLTVPEPAALALADLLAERIAGAGVDMADLGGGRWQVTLYTPDAPDPALLAECVAAVLGTTAPAFVVTELPEENWVARSLAGLHPVRAGRFLVHGCHDRAARRPNDIAIEIEAGEAFGTGHHGTTAGCLLALDRWLRRQRKAKPTAHASPRPGGERAVSLARAQRGLGERGEGAGTFQERPPLFALYGNAGSPSPGATADALAPASPHRGEAKKLPFPSSRLRRGGVRGGGAAPAKRPAPRALDLGTGSGVLAIALAKAGRLPVLATDIDPRAAAIAAANARLNGAAGLVTVIAADGLNHPAFRRAQPPEFALIIANILAGPLAALAPALARRLAPGGTMILSGLLPAQQARIVAAYRNQGLALRRASVLDGWLTLELARRPG